MQTINKNLKKIIKVFITYTIENDIRIYQLKHTPFKVERSLIKKAYQIYGNDPINAKKLYLIITWEMAMDVIVNM